MNKLDWKGVGQFIAVCVKLSTLIIGVFKRRRVGIEIMEWLQGEGSTTLEKACDRMADDYFTADAWVKIEKAKARNRKPNLTNTGPTFGSWLRAREVLHKYLTGEEVDLCAVFNVPRDLLDRTDIMPVFRPAGATNRMAMNWRVKLGELAPQEEVKVDEYTNSEGPKVPELYYINRSVKPDPYTLGENAESPDGNVESKRPWLGLYGWSDADLLHFLITGVHLDSGNSWTWFPNDRLPGDSEIACGCCHKDGFGARFLRYNHFNCFSDTWVRVATPIPLRT